MSDIARPRFRIFRVDPPVESEAPPADSHYRAFWEIEGQTFRVHVWSDSEWERLSPTRLPSNARSINGRGWMVMQPVETS
jgi:hypothetical protein